MKHRIITLFLFLCIVCVLTNAQNNLVKNGTFELKEQIGASPKVWVPHCWNLVHDFNTGGLITAQVIKSGVNKSSALKLVHQNKSTFSSASQIINLPLKGKFDFSCYASYVAMTVENQTAEIRILDAELDTVIHTYSIPLTGTMSVPPMLLEDESIMRKFTFETQADSIELVLYSNGINKGIRFDNVCISPSRTIAPSTHTLQDSILFTGRFDFRKSDRVMMSLPSSSVKANFYGTGISAVLAVDTMYANKITNWDSHFEIIVDGDASIPSRTVFVVHGNSPKSYVLVDGLELGEHQIEIVKSSEAHSKVSFYGFEVEGGSLLAKPRTKNLLFEFYGDSNAAGYDAFDPFDYGKDTTLCTGNYAYVGQASRMLDADFVNVSHSSWGITTQAMACLPNRYHQIHIQQKPDDGDTLNVWNFQNYMPDVVVVNLGSNDMSRKQDNIPLVKAGWKDFVQNKLRLKYPLAHIVFCESYGWHLNGPDAALPEVIDDLHAAGETNVSYVLFPWVWGQTHAVVNEHAYTAYLLAQHIANRLYLPEPKLTALSSHPKPSQIFNGSFEKTTINGFADGWRMQRPNRGQTTLITDANEAADSTNYYKVENGYWIQTFTETEPGKQFTAKVKVKSDFDGLKSGKLLLYFLNKGQEIIATSEQSFVATSEWTDVECMSDEAPEGTKLLWIRLLADKTAEVDFDHLELFDGAGSSVPETQVNSLLVQCLGYKKYVITSDESMNNLQVIDLSGSVVFASKASGNEMQLDLSHLSDGIYMLGVSTSCGTTFIKQYVK